MCVSAKHRCIFVHIPKCAGTSVCAALNMPFEHHKASHYEKLYPEQWGSYFKFTIVRNPFTRVLSNYLFAKMDYSYHCTLDPGRPPPRKTVHGYDDFKPHPDYFMLRTMTFEDCLLLLEAAPHRLQHPGWRTQDIYMDRPLDKICRLENIHEDWKDVQQATSCEVALPQLNKSKQVDPKEYYTNQEMVDIVKRVYAKDFELLGYQETL